MKRGVVTALGIVLAAVLILKLYEWDAGRTARWSERERVAQALVDSLEGVARARDTVYVRDTVRLWRSVTAYDTARITDTLTRNDTVFVPRAVADAALAACLATVLTCEQRVADRDDQLRAAERRFEAHLKTHPSRVKTLVGDALKVLGGYGLGRLQP